MARKMIEFFSGSKRMSEAFKAAGYDVLTLDNDPALCADIQQDFLSLDFSDIPAEFRRRPWAVWASPPCQAFSVAALSNNWERNRPVSEKALKSLELINKLLDFIKLLEPEYFFIENPRAMLRVSINGLPFQRHTITYCQYGESYMKPTDIWTNSVRWFPRPPCKSGDKCHDRAPRGSKEGGVQSLKGAYLRGVLPSELCSEIVESCLYKNKTLLSYETEGMRPLGCLYED